jgi:enoyl-CoA hydratase/carnithine racemase
MNQPISGLPEGVGREVLYEIVAEHIAVISINRPDKRNAVNGPAAMAIDYLVRQVETDARIRVGILTSTSGQAFCTGADLNEIAAGRVCDILTPDGGFAGFTDSRREKPWLAAVRGLAVGGGFELALACDLIIASEDARFSLPEVRRGFIAAAGGVSRLARAIPRNVALELVATGGMLDSERAHALGLVNYRVPSAAVRDTAVSLARVIAANAPLAVRQSLSIARQHPDLSDAQLRDLSIKAAGRVMASEDAKEGARAFLEKRPPRWSER